MDRVIVVTSGKGGVGKTTLTANIGRELCALGASVALLDTDIGLNNLDVVLDIESKIVFDLVDVVENRCRLRQALIEVTPGLCVLPSAHSYDRSRITAQNIKAVVRQLAQTFDYVLLDCPAGIENGFHRAVSAANQALVVVTPHISSIRDADKVIRLLSAYKLDSTQVIVNRVRGDLVLSSEMLGAADIAEILKAAIIGIIPDDDGINLISNLGLISNRGGEGASALKMLARNIHFGTNEQFDPAARYRGLIGRIKRRLKKLV